MQASSAGLLLSHIRISEYSYKFCGKIQLVWADRGYKGTQLAAWLDYLLGWFWQVVKRNESITGFQVQPKRWISSAELRLPKERTCYACSIGSMPGYRSIDE